MYEVYATIEMAKQYREDQIRTAQEHQRAQLVREGRPQHLHIPWDRVAAFLHVPHVAHHH